MELIGGGKIELLKSLLGGAGGAAIVSGLYGLVQWWLNRKAQKEDRAADGKAAICKQHGADMLDLSRKMDILFLADRTILYDRIKHLAKSYISQGFVTIEDLEDINRMHSVYHDPDKLDGNGFLTDLMHTVNSLEIRAK